MSSREVLAAVRRHWELDVTGLQPLTGGMNSRTWTVLTASSEHAGSGCWVAKLVRSDQHDTLVRGLQAAALVEAAGVPAGAPVLTHDGDDHVDLPIGALALLGRVDGDPLVGRDEQEQVLIGTTLGAAHRVLRGVVDVSAHDFPRWLDPTAGHLAVEDWVGPAVSSALSDYRALDHDGLAFGLLHADPEPGAFLCSSGRPDRCALIDWSSAEHGPLLYDLASALMYVGGTRSGQALLEAYATAVGARPADLTEGVDVLLALRQAVQADYFARRLVTGDLTGIADAEENRHGLHAARDFFRPVLKSSRRVRRSWGA